MRRRPICAPVLAALLLMSFTSAAVARKPAAVRSTNTIVSTGSGIQLLEGGGLTYGSLGPGGDVRVVDLSPKRDGKFTVTALAPATTAGGAAQNVAVKPVRLGNQLVFRLKQTRQNAGRSLAFSVAGSKFRLVLDGDSVLNGAGMTGHVTLAGTGTITVNGADPPLEWATAGRIALPAKNAGATKPTTTAPTTTSGAATTS